MSEYEFERLSQHDMEKVICFVSADGGEPPLPWIKSWLMRRFGADLDTASKE